MQFWVFWGLNWGQESTFFIQENIAFMQLSNYPSHNQFQPAMNKWWKLNDVLLRVNKFCVNLERNLWKIDWNIALTYIWGKHKVKPLDRLFRFLLLNISTINSTCSYISMHHLINWLPQVVHSEESGVMKESDREELWVNVMYFSWSQILSNASLSGEN